MRAMEQNQGVLSEELHGGDLQCYLTQASSGSGITGSCWLKDARGIKYAGDETINFQLVASAYISES